MYLEHKESIIQDISLACAEAMSAGVGREGEFEESCHCHCQCYTGMPEKPEARRGRDGPTRASAFTNSSRFVASCSHFELTGSKATSHSLESTQAAHISLFSATRNCRCTLSVWRSCRRPSSTSLQSADCCSCGGMNGRSL